MMKSQFIPSPPNRLPLVTPTMGVRVVATLLSVGVAAATAAATVAAWDAGPDACVHRPCNGGVLEAETVTDSRPAWDDWVPASTTGGSGGGRCPTGRAAPSWAPNRCYVACPPRAVRTDPSTCVHTIRWRGNTHLWVANGAVTLLARSTSPAARAAAAALNGTACRDAWESGMWGEDLLGRADNPLDGDRRGTHFFNARGVRYDGRKTSVVTYTYLWKSTDNSALKEMATLVSRLGSLIDPSVETCKTLGAALHYVTDMMPFHSSGYSAFSSPPLLHAVAEYYVPTIQAAHPPVGGWSSTSGPGRGAGVEAAFVAASVESNKLAPALISAFADGDGDDSCTMTPDAPVVYRGYCFLGDPAVDREVGRALALGYDTTATWLAELWRTKAMT